MQARMRRNRIVALISSALLVTSTCDVKGNRVAMLNSSAAKTVFAATTETDANLTEEQAVSNSLLAIGEKLTAYVDEAETYEVPDHWKADISDYDESLSLISYETAAFLESEDPLTTTIAESSDSTQPVNTTAVTSYTTTVATMTTLAEPAITAATTVCAPANSVVFYSSGFGHGVGMSQNGANFYAQYDGWTYDQILAHYYPGTELVQTGVSPSKYITIGNCSGDIVSVISQVINVEMGPSMATEALKAQAVAIYSFYLYNHGGSGLRGKANPSKKIVDAVRSVVGQAIYYNGQPANAMFYASSGGATASCKDIFYADIPYLVSVPVAHDETCDPNYCVSTVFSYNTLKSKLERVYGVRLSGSPYDWIQLNYGDGGYVASAVIGGKVTVKGNELRTVLGLRSPKFEFVYQSGNTPPPVAQITTTVTSATEPQTTPTEATVVSTETVGSSDTTSSEMMTETTATSAVNE